MEITEALRFVKGAVAKKDLLPALTHFRIEEGTIRSFNGSLALSSPIALELTCTPKATPFTKAIPNCKDTVTMKMTPNGRLSISSGKFRAFIECVPEDVETGHTLPEGDEFTLDGEAFLNALKTVEPFIGDDASRPWSNGVLFKGQSAYATNNVSLVEYWVGSTFPIICNLPKEAVKEILRIGEPPIKAQATENSLSLHFPGNKWLRTQLLDIAWPDLEKVLDVESNPTPINQELFDGLAVIKPFLDEMGRVFFLDGGITTTITKDDGASFDIGDFNHEGVYRLEILSLLKDRANRIDWTLYPNPCIFYGDRLRGALIGMKV